MKDKLFDAAWRTKTLVNRTDELEQIRDSIYVNDSSCHVVMIVGKGGMGKSRLLEESVWRGGNPKARAELGPIPPEHAEEWERMSTTGGSQP